MQQQIDISTLSLTELKALAFDAREQRDLLDRNVEALRIEIAQRQRPLPPATEKPEPPPAEPRD